MECEYLGEKVAIGIVAPDGIKFEGAKMGMQVMQGVVVKKDERVFFDVEGHPPFEMSEGWLDMLKPVTEDVGPEFQGAKYCLIINP